MASSAAPPNPPDVLIPVGGATGIGEFTVPPPTFLERWGVVFVSVSGIWMLGISIATLWFYLAHLSFPPAQSSTMTPTDYRALLELHKTATDQFRDSVSFAFDLMVTKTMLPLLTLLLGYLFGSKKT